MNVSNASTVKENDLFEGTTTIVIYVCIGTVGIMGNSFVIFVFTKSSNMMKKMVNILLINQSAVDLVASLCLMTIGHVKSGKPIVATFSGVAADLYCRIIGPRTFIWGFATCSTWNLVFINVERFISVSFPVWHKTSFNKRHTIVVICFVWIFGLLFNFCTTFFTSKYSDGKCLLASEWATEELAILGSAATFSVHFILPVLIMILCYIVIIYVLMQRNKVGSSSNTSSSGQEKIGKNVFKTLALVSLTFIICWAPNTIVFALFVTKLNIKIITTPFYHFTVYLVFINCCLNPFIYAAQYKDFQRQMKKLLCRTTSEDNVTSATSAWLFLTAQHHLS